MLLRQQKPLILNLMLREDDLLFRSVRVKLKFFIDWLDNFLVVLVQILVEKAWVRHFRVGLSRFWAHAVHLVLSGKILPISCRLRVNSLLSRGLELRVIGQLWRCRPHDLICKRLNSAVLGAIFLDGDHLIYWGTQIFLLILLGKYLLFFGLRGVIRVKITQSILSRGRTGEVGKGWSSLREFWDVGVNVFAGRRQIFRSI